METVTEQPIKKIEFFRCPQSLPGVAPLTKKPEDSGYEIVRSRNNCPFFMRPQISCPPQHLTNQGHVTIASPRDHKNLEMPSQRLTLVLVLFILGDREQF